MALWDFCFQRFAVGSLNAGVRGPFCMPEGKCCLCRYELRVCQMFYQSSCHSYFSQGRQCKDLNIWLASCFSCLCRSVSTSSFISRIALFLLCATLPGISDSLPLPLIEPHLKPRIRRQSSQAKKRLGESETKAGFYSFEVGSVHIIGLVNIHKTCHYCAKQNKASGCLT